MCSLLPYLPNDIYEYIQSFLLPRIICEEGYLIQRSPTEPSDARTALALKLTCKRLLARLPKPYLNCKPVPVPPTMPGTIFVRFVRGVDCWHSLYDREHAILQHRTNFGIIVGCMVCLERVIRACNWTPTDYWIQHG